MCSSADPGAEAASVPVGYRLVVLVGVQASRVCDVPSRVAPRLEGGPSKVLLLGARFAGVLAVWASVYVGAIWFSRVLLAGALPAARAGASASAAGAVAHPSSGPASVLSKADWAGVLPRLELRVLVASSDGRFSVAR